jgi:DNA-directed RNA polymerase specialized sigma subunit
MVAINTYNTDKCNFNTFAVKNMRRKISELTVHLSTALSFNHSAFYRIRQVDKRLAKGMTITEIANELNISPKQVKVLANYSFTAFNENIKADDMVYIDTNEMYDHLEYLVDTELDKFSGFVLRKYFGLHCKKMTMQEIADKCDCNRLKVLRTLHKALDLLKQLI